ncbi:MAG: dUTP diphosphatase [Firmicutes bacterium]|nr:dUTP diphosphatase [Bacillota bacterium]
MMPNYATGGSAGLDLYAALKEEIILKPGEIKSISTGIAFHIGDKSIAGFVFSRSGLSSRNGIALVNSVGVIDSDYTGEIICPMINLSKNTYTIKPKDRIAQIVFMPIYLANLALCDELESTERGSGGFGSTGR